MSAQWRSCGRLGAQTPPPASALRAPPLLRATQPQRARRQQILRTRARLHADGQVATRAAARHHVGAAAGAAAVLHAGGGVLAEALFRSGHADFPASPRRRFTPSSIAKRVAASVFPKFALRANGEDKRRSQIAAPALAEVSLFGPVQWLHPTGARSEPRRSARCVTERIRRLRRAAGVLGPSGTSGQW